jgi:hypothetical protein
MLFFSQDLEVWGRLPWHEYLPKALTVLMDLLILHVGSATIAKK